MERKKLKKVVIRKLILPEPEPENFKGIAYVVKYDSYAKKGVLVYGYKASSHIFQEENCLSCVETGQLVYCEIQNGKVQNIERASLANFKRDILKKYSAQSCIAFYAKIRIDTDVSIETLCEAIDNHYSRNTKDYRHIAVLDIKYWLDKSVVKNNCYGTTYDQFVDIHNFFVNKDIDSKKGLSGSTVNEETLPNSWKYLISIIPHHVLCQICSQTHIYQQYLPEDFCLSHLNLLSFDYGFCNKLICTAYFNFMIQQVQTIKDYDEIKNYIYNAMNCGVHHKEDEGFTICKLGTKLLNALSDSLQTKLKTAIPIRIKNEINVISKERINGQELLERCVKRNDIDYIRKLGLFVYKYNHVCKNENDLESYYSLVRYYNVLCSEEKALLEESVKDRVFKCLTMAIDNCLTDGNIDKFYTTFRSFPEWITPSFKCSIREKVNAVYTALNDLQFLYYALDLDLITKEQYLSFIQRFTNDSDLSRLMSLINLKKTEISEDGQDLIIKHIIDNYSIKEISNYCYYHSYTHQEDCARVFSWIESNCNNETTKDELKSKIFSNLNKEERWLIFTKELIEDPLMDNIRWRLNKAYRHQFFSDIPYRRDCFQKTMVEDVKKESDIRMILFILRNLNHSYLDDLKACGLDYLRFYVWVVKAEYNINDGIDWNLTKKFYPTLPAQEQLQILKYIFSLKALGKTDFSADTILSKLQSCRDSVCISVRIILLLLKQKVDNPQKCIAYKDIVSIFDEMKEFDKRACILLNEIEERMIPENTTELYVLPTIQDEELYNYDYPCNEFCYYDLNMAEEKILNNSTKQTKRFVESMFYKCNGARYLVSSWDQYNDIFASVEKKAKNKELFFVVSFYEYSIRDNISRSIDEYTFEKVYYLLRNNIPFDLIDEEFWISTKYETELKETLWSSEIGVENGFLDTNVSTGRVAKSSKHLICRCTNCLDLVPKMGIPFCWCEKEPCLCKNVVLNSPTEWKMLKFSDLLYIIGNEKFSNKQLWNMYSEVAAFVEEIFNNNNTAEAISHIVQDEDNRGVWKKDMSIEAYAIADYVYDEDGEEPEDEWDEEEYMICNSDKSNYLEEPTYNRYNGSYAQDVMGFSDDDIDEILDGDPDAYWNID